MPLGFEKVLRLAAGAGEYQADRAGLKAASETLKQENPKAFEAVGEFIFQTSVNVGERVNPSHFASFGDGISACQIEGQSLNGTLWIDTTPGQDGIHSMILRNDKTHGPNPCLPPRRSGPVRPPALPPWTPGCSVRWSRTSVRSESSAGSTTRS